MFMGLYLLDSLATQPVSQKIGGLRSLFKKPEIKYSSLIFIFMFKVMVVVVGGWHNVQRKTVVYASSWAYGMSDNCLCLSVSLVTFLNYPLGTWCQMNVWVFLCACLHVLLCGYNSSQVNPERMFWTFNLFCLISSILSGSLSLWSQRKWAGLNFQYFPECPQVWPS